jgi:hypothetical protein
MSFETALGKEVGIDAKGSWKENPPVRGAVVGLSSENEVEVSLPSASTGSSSLMSAQAITDHPSNE